MHIRDLTNINEVEGKTASFAFGRMNPPTIGHKKLADAVLAQAGDPYIFLSQSQKPQTDPLDFVTKLALARKFFPGVSVGDPSVKTIIQALTKLDSLGYDNIIYVAGSDRIQDFTELLNKYNGKADKQGNIAYTFKDIQVVSAGERDPDAEGAEGMSASKMRAAAAKGDFEAFKSGTPEPKLAQTMYDRVRAGMGIKEEAPPGREKQVKALKGKVDNPYAVAWASYNKSKKVIETLQDLHRAKPLDEATTQYVLKQVTTIREHLNNINEAYSPEIDDKWMEKEIRANAKKHGIDPNVAVRVWRSEGGSSKNYQSKIKRSGKGSDGGREASYGPYQLYTGGGLGNEYQEKYGVNLSADNSPEGLSRQIDFALGKAKKVGWKPWYGAAKAGIGDRDGIDGTQYADAGNIATDAGVDNSGPSDFGAAFASARKKQGGPGGKFKYQGKEYQTNVKGEKYVTNPVSVDEATTQYVLKQVATIREHSINEKRRFPDKNQKESLLSSLLKYEGQNVFISFQRVKKLGINPRFNFDGSPLGVYSYFLPAVLDDFKKLGSVQKGVDFGSERPYVFIFKVNDLSNVIDVQAYSNTNLKKDLKKLNLIIQDTHEDANKFFAGLQKKKRTKYPFEILMTAIAEIAEYESSYMRKLFVQLGYYGIMDNVGSTTTTRHYAIKESIFFSTEHIKVIDMFINHNPAVDDIAYKDGKPVDTDPFADTEIDYSNYLQTDLGPTKKVKLHNSGPLEIIEPGLTPFKVGDKISQEEYDEYKEHGLEIKNDSKIKEHLNNIKEATLDLPDLETGDELMVGKFKNRKATIKDFKKDEHGQPVAVTNKGDQKIFKGRVKKLMPTEGKSPHKKGTEKYRKHMAAMHAGMNEAKKSGSYLLQLERDDDIMVLTIKSTKTGQRTEVRGKPGYELDGYDATDPLHQMLDKVGKAANISDLMNGDVVSINPNHPDGPRAREEFKQITNEGISYANPQFGVEWEEANRYPYLEKLGSEGWEELAKTGRAVRVTTDSVKKIGNTGADGSESLDDLEPEKVARLKQAMDSGTVEMPIVVKQPDGSLELIAGNTRLIGLISTQDEAQVWLVDASTLTEDESRTDFELDDIAPELRPAVRQAMIKFPMAKDRLSAVIRMLQQDTLKQQKNIKNINRLDTENDVQDVEIDTSEDDITSLKNKIDALGKRISSEQDITNLKNKISDLEARIVPAKDSKVKEGVGRIVKGVNTTPDVGVNQTKIEAAKLGSKVDKDGRPPVLERGSIGVPLSSGLTVNVAPHRELKIKKSTKGRLNYENPRTNRQPKSKRGATV